MARPKGNPRDLLKRIESALKVVKKTDILPAAPMAEMLGMTWRNLLETYIRPDPQFPIKTRGSAGVNFEFEAVKVLRHLAKRCKERIAAAEKAAARMAELANITVPAADEGAPQSYAELRQGLLAHSEIEKMRREQRHYIPSDEVDGFISGMTERVMMTVLGARAKADPTGSWPVELASAFDNALRDLATDLQESLSDYLEGLNVDNPAQPSGPVVRAGRVGGGTILRQTS